ncbi:MAG: endonuclease [Flavobacteriales bacterium]|nr:endonuclease [Flavobacteriales bacterium]MCB9194531.1 endonuclease [Flavobacteriales bacterium]
MHLRYLLPVLWICSACGHSVGQPPPGYYDSAQGLTGPALRQALHDIIDGHVVQSNASLWTAFQSTDVRPDGHVWDIYSDLPGSTPPYLFTFVTDQCGNYSGEGDCYNREHTFPKSWFNDAPPMDTDLHHIFPTDAWVNQHRGNLPYGEVGSADWTSENGTKVGLCTFPGYNGTVCEPIDDFKGDLARTYFYMMTRYMDLVGSWSSPMLQGGDLAPWAGSMLLQWDQDDPVSTKEQDRNNAVYALQENRNPYIDHPEWVTSIWGPTAGIHAAPIVNWSASADATGLHIRMERPVEGTILLIDAMGRTIWNGSINGSRFDGGPMDLVPGVYAVAMHTGSGGLAHRLLR